MPTADSSPRRARAAAPLATAARAASPRPDARAPVSQRNLVIASLLRCPDAGERGRDSHRLRLA